jgi:hypothetical protein
MGCGCKKAGLARKVMRVPAAAKQAAAQGRLRTASNKPVRTSPSHTRLPAGKRGHR